MSDRPGSDQDQLFYNSLIRGYVDDPGFVQRGWLEQQIDTVLADPGCRFLLLTAEPGAGKTALAAWLADRNPAWPRYFIRRDSRTPLSSGDARSFLLAVGHQMATVRPQLFELENFEIVVEQSIGTVGQHGRATAVSVKDFIVSPFRKTTLRISQEAEVVAGKLEGLSATRLVTEPRLLELNNLQFLALIGPAQVAQRTEPDTQIVIVLDALDELRYYLGQDGVLNWLGDCPELPSNVRIVLTSRPDENLLSHFRQSQGTWLRELSIDPHSTQVRQDLILYAGGFINRLSLQGTLERTKVTVDSFTENAVAKADGNFQYLAALFRGIEGFGLDEQESVDQLIRLQEVPADLGELYAFFLGRIRQRVVNQDIPVPGRSPADEPRYLPAWEGVYLPLLGVLAVAREPLTAAQLAAFARPDIQQRWLTEALGRLDQFLDREDRLYRLYHSTLPEFLTAEVTRKLHSNVGVDPFEWHRGIAAFYLNLNPQID